MATKPHKEREWPQGSGNYYPMSDAELPMILDLNDQDRRSGVRHSASRCAISTTLKDKLGALAVETGHERLWVLWRNEHGPHKGKIAWQRWDIAPAGRRGIEAYDANEAPGVPIRMQFKVVKPSERLGPDGKSRKSQKRKQWPSSQPDYVTKKPQPRKMIASRSLTGQIHLRAPQAEEE